MIKEHLAGSIHSSLVWNDAIMYSIFRFILVTQLLDSL